MIDIKISYEIGEQQTITVQYRKAVPLQISHVPSKLQTRATIEKQMRKSVNVAAT